MDIFKIILDVQKVIYDSDLNSLFLLSDFSLTVLDIKTNEQKILLDIQDKLNCMTNYKNYLFIGTEEGKIIIFDKQKNISCFKMNNQSNRIKGLQVIYDNFPILVVASSNGNFLISGSIKLYDVLVKLDQNQIKFENQEESIEPFYSIDTRLRINCIHSMDKSWQNQQIIPVNTKLKLVKQQPKESQEQNEEGKNLMKYKNIKSTDKLKSQPKNKDYKKKDTKLAKKIKKNKDQQIKDQNRKFGMKKSEKMKKSNSKSQKSDKKKNLKKQ